MAYDHIEFRKEGDAVFITLPGGAVAKIAAENLRCIATGERYQSTDPIGERYRLPLQVEVPEGFELLGKLQVEGAQ